MEIACLVLGQSIRWWWVSLVWQPKRHWLDLPGMKWAKRELCPQALWRKRTRFCFGPFGYALCRFSARKAREWQEGAWVRVGQNGGSLHRRLRYIQCVGRLIWFFHCACARGSVKYGSTFGYWLDLPVNR